MANEKTNYFLIIAVGVIAIAFATMLRNTEPTQQTVHTSKPVQTAEPIQPSYPEGQFDCSLYKADLHKIANTPEDLIETHRASGVIKQVDENEKYYVVVITPSLWTQTTAEQRQLIRCSTTEIAASKGKEGGIVDPVKNERLY